MKRRHRLTVLVALLILTTTTTPLTNAQQSAPTGPEQPQTVPIPQAPGFYIVGGSRNLDPAVFNHSGDMQFYTWADLNPASGTYNFALIQNYINNHYWPPAPGQPGKYAAVSLTAYDGRGGNGAAAMPQWVRNLPNTTIPGVLSEQVRNGGFEQGTFTSWSPSGDVTLDTSNPHGGSRSARLGPGSPAELVQYSVRIPKVLAHGQIVYWWRSAVTGSPDPDDRLVVEILDGSSVVVQVQNVTGLGNQGWQQRTLDLRPYDGHWSTLRFRLINDGDSNQTRVWIDDASLTVQPLVPKYWDSAYKNAYQTFVTALGNAFRNESRLDFISMGTGEFGETRATDNADDPATQAAGLDSAGWIATVNEITGMYLAAFSQGGQLRKVLLLQNAPFQYYASERPAFSTYAADRDVGLSFNGLFYDWNFAETYPYNNAGSTWRTAAYDAMLEHGDRVPVAFETYSSMVGDTTSLGSGVADSFYWAVLNALDKHTSYLRMSGYTGWFLGANDEPVTAYTDIMAWAKPYLGATLDPASPRFAPSVWVAMREHMNPICYYGTTDCEVSSHWPPLGNFEFWLYQRDSIAGGRTVPETHVDAIVTSSGTFPPAQGLCPPGSAGPAGYPCYNNTHNPALPPVREAQFIRRTDQATGNPSMFFDIDDGYMHGGVNDAEITLTYWDRGSDRFRLQYDSTSGPKHATPAGSANPWVQKTASNQFRTVTFLVNDARFGNSLTGGTDFVIDSRNQNAANDGDEWIHMVDVAASNPYDVNDDGVVNVLDVTLVAQNWRSTNPAALASYDLNRNGVVDVPDVMLVTAHWQG